MITLATLPEATPQQVFDQVVAHLRKQGARAMNEEGDCKYHEESGNKCAAGCLIGEDEYDADLEENNWGSLVKSEKVPSNHDNLIESLQDVHDLNTPDEWEEAFERVAEVYGLTYTKEDV